MGHYDDCYEQTRKEKLLKEEKKLNKKLKNNESFLLNKHKEIKNYCYEVNFSKIVYNNAYADEGYTKVFLDKKQALNFAYRIKKKYGLIKQNTDFFYDNVKEIYFAHNSNYYKESINITVNELELVTNIFL